MKKRKGEFSEKTRLLLERRAGNRCSFPGCGSPTSGPSAESKSSISNTGMACHIVAASDGPAARRIEPTWGPKELSDISNGIWMCYSHGKLIDTDDSTYTVEVLKTWVQLAELRATMSQANQKDVELTPALLKKYPMPEYCTNILGPESGFDNIGNAIEASCMSQIWGVDISRAIRDVLIEVAQNSLTHGAATSVKLKIHNRSVQLSDDGKQFNPLILNGKSKDGCGLAIDRLIRKYGTNLYYSYKYSNGINCLELSVVSSVDEIKALTNCTADVPSSLFWGVAPNLKIPSECIHVYLMFPSNISYSWVKQVPQLLTNSVRSDQEIILVGQQLSEGVIEYLKVALPDVRVINL